MIEKVCVVIKNIVETFFQQDTVIHLPVLQTHRFPKRGQNFIQDASLSLDTSLIWTCISSSVKIN